MKHSRYKIVFRRFGLSPWVLALAIVPLAGAILRSPSALGAQAGGSPSETRSDDPHRARTPLSEIAAAPAPAPATVTPPEDVPAVQAACQQARALIEDECFQAAVETLTGTSQQSGGDRYEFHYLLALARVRLGQLDAARTSAEAAVRLAHGDADAHYLLGEICSRQGADESAIPHYRSATLAAERELNNPNVALAWYHLGRTLASTGYDLAAAEAYEQFDLAAWQTHPEQRNAAEIAAVVAGRPLGMVPERLRLLRTLGCAEETVRVAEWAREVWPDDLSATRSYAEALLFAEQAEAAFGFCRDRWDDLEHARVLLPIAVEAARAAGQLEAWIGTVERGVEDGQGLEQALELTRHLSSIGASTQAVRVGRALSAQLPADGDVAWEVAVAQQASDDLRGALDTLIAFVRNDPDMIEWPQRRLAIWMGWCENSTRVVELTSELRARSEADFATDFVLGVSALAADQLALADELLQACITARPQYAPAYVVQGRTLLTTYQWDAAKTHARGVLEELPDLAAAHFLLAEAHAGLDENEQAERAYKQAIKLRPEEPAYSLALAREYRRLGNLLGAQRYFQTAFANDPANGEALEGLIDCYLRGGKVEIARAQLERLDQDAIPSDALRRINTSMGFFTPSAAFGPGHLAELKSQFDESPADLATARLLAGGLYYRGRFDETLEVIQKVRAANPDDYQFAILLANLHAARGEHERAISVLETLVKRFPNRRTILEPLAVCCMHDFRLEEGRAALRRLIEVDKDSGEQYRSFLLEVYLAFGECDQALELVEERFAQNPDGDEMIHEKINVLLECDRNDEAFELAERLLEEDPDDYDRRRAFVVCGKKADRCEPVADRLRQWLEDTPDNATLAEALIDVLLLGEHPDEALQVARDFEGTYSESLQRRIWLGRCQAAKGETDIAVAEFGALLNERVPEEVLRGVRKLLVTALSEAQRHDEALERCQGWLKEVEGKDKAAVANVLLLKGTVLQDLGRDKEYAEVIEVLLDHAPDNASLLNDLGYTWVDMGINIERATEMIKRAATANPWGAAVIDSLGWAYYKAGDFSNARKYLARAARLREGQDPVVYDHLADAAYRLGDRDAARLNWNESLSLAEGEASERDRIRLADLIAAVRAKLGALERSETPAVAPTAEEQNREERD